MNRISIVLLISIFVSNTFVGKNIYSQIETKTSLENYNNEFSKFTFGILTGASISTTSFNTKTGIIFNYHFLTKEKLISSVSPLFGLSLNYSPNTVKTFTFYGDIMYNSQYYKGIFTDYRNENSQIIYDYSFGISSIRLSFLVKYYFTKNILRPYLGVGFYTSATVSEKNELIIELHHFDEVNSNDLELFTEWKNTALFGFNAELGVEYNVLNFGLRYDAANIGTMKYLTNSSKSISIFISFLISSKE